MAKAIHMMIRVTDEQRSVAFYREALGLGIADRFVFDSFTLVYLRNPEADFEIELTINHGRTEPYTLGNGYAHVAVAVDDLDAGHARLAAGGVAPESIKEFHRDGAPMARFFFLTDPDGSRIEVLQRHGRYRCGRYRCGVARGARPCASRLRRWPPSVAPRAPHRHGPATHQWSVFRSPWIARRRRPRSPSPCRIGDRTS